MSDSATLRQTADLLRARAWSAQQLATRLGISKQAAHKRIEALEASGVRLRQKRVRLSLHGPLTVQYRIMEDAPDAPKDPEVAQVSEGVPQDDPAADGSGD